MTQTTMSEDKKHLRELLEDIAKAKDYTNACVDVQAISSGGGSYSSALYLVTISAPPKEDLKLFAKVANIDPALRAKDEIYSLGFETERIFYTELVLVFEKLYNKHNVPENDRLYIPKYYGEKFIECQETLVLENLSAKGYESFDRNQTFDWDYASKSVEELAKFHALGLACREENREEYESFGKTLLVDVFSDEKMVNSFMKQAIKMGTQIIKEENRVRMEKYFEENNILDGIEKLWKPIEGGFLIHGDYRPSNLMHRSRNGNVEVVPIDFQTVHFGVLAADLMYFIWSGSDSHFRQCHYQHLLDHYYQALTLALQNLHMDINNFYPRKTFEEELDGTKSLGLFLGLAMMPILTVEPENAPVMDNFDNLMLKPNQLALDRMNGVVDDYIRWGIIK